MASKQSSGELDLSRFRGLTQAEAEARLEAEGYNELPAAKRRSTAAIALEVMRQPIFLLLVAAGLIYVLLGDVREALMLLSFVFVVMGITIYQEQKTEHALEALRDLSSPRARVLRDGEQRRIPGREVARGDLVFLAEGDRVPADGIVLWSANLQVDESLLTGESLPVNKQEAPDPDHVTAMQTPEHASPYFTYSGTLVVQGQALVRILATGPSSELGKIGRSLQALQTEETPLQRETGRLVRVVAVFGMSICAVVVIAYGLTRGDWLQGTLAGIAVAMAMLPEEFPVVLTIFLALGAWRLSRRNVLTRRVPTVETLGAATVLCVDKTGTLTMNQMAVRGLCTEGACYLVSAPLAEPLPERYHALVEFSILASQRDPFDPMEKALRELGERALADTEHLHADWTLVREYPLSKELLALSHVWQSPTGEEFIIAAKGAPEAIAGLCHLDEIRAATLTRQVQEMAANGLRVIGVARAAFKQPSLPGEQHAFAFTFIGLIGLADPVRPTVPGAIRECYQAGIRVVMITGDHPGTAQNIAREIGLNSSDAVITGPELAVMSDDELRQRIGSVNIFARVVPEQKLRLVTALKANGEIVAMTGDGVNDAPALKAAHIGIALGGRGTDVAREAAALVLLDDDFSSIVGAVRMGRRIYDNLQKAMAYIIAIHVPIAGLSLLPVLLQWPLVLFPEHIVFLELIIDPTSSIVFETEAEEAGVMRRPPRPLNEPLFGRRTLIISVLQGLSVLGIVLGVYAAALALALGENEARALTFSALIVANLGLIFTNRSWSRTIFATLRTPNRALWAVIAGAIIFLVLALTVPFLRAMFRFSPLPGSAAAIAAAAGLFSILWFEVLKWIIARHVRH